MRTVRIFIPRPPALGKLLFGLGTTPGPTPVPFGVDTVIASQTITLPAGQALRIITSAFFTDVVDPQTITLSIKVDGVVVDTGVVDVTASTPALFTRGLITGALAAGAHLVELVARPSGADLTVAEDGAKVNLIAVLPPP